MMEAAIANIVVIDNIHKTICLILYIVFVGFFCSCIIDMKSMLILDLSLDLLKGIGNMYTIKSRANIRRGSKIRRTVILYVLKLIEINSSLRNVSIVKVRILETMPIIEINTKNLLYILIAFS